MEKTTNLQRQFKNTTKIRKCQAIFTNNFRLRQVKSQKTRQKIFAGLRFGLQFGLHTPTFLVYETAFSCAHAIGNPHSVFK